MLDAVDIDLNMLWNRQNIIRNQMVERRRVTSLREDRRMDHDIARVMQLLGSNALTPEVPCP